MCQNKNNEIKVKMAKEVNNASIESPMIYNADLKLENRVEGNKYQTSKFINKPIRVHFQDNHLNEKDEKHEQTTKDSRDPIQGSTQNVIIEPIDFKVPRKRTRSVIDYISQDFFENIKDSKKNARKSVSSKITVSQIHHHAYNMNEDEENSVSEESHKRKEDNIHFKKIDAIDKIERLPALDEVEGDEEDSLSMN